MLVAVTGANGFVGRAVARHLREAQSGASLRLIDRAFSSQREGEAIALDLAQPGAIEAAVHGADCVIHLAALPGAAAERDPALSRRINLDLSLELMERMAGRRLIYASSVAVFGNRFPEQVDDETAPTPASVYGTHKRMTELAFADMVRRGALSGMVLRIPGVVARPSEGAGFGSAFLSEMFHAAREARPLDVPLDPAATTWLMSSRICAANFVRAAFDEAMEREPVNLPALRVSIRELVAALALYGDTARFRFVVDARTRELFGSHPPLKAHRAQALGLLGDGTVEQLVANVFADG